MQNAPFTIKHITPDGDTFLCPAAIITCIGSPIPGGPARGIALPPKKIEFDMGRGDGLKGSVSTGVVYVLNQNGKTVDTYHFPLTEAEQASEA
ncbi:hypothetical protein [Salipiger abyssi]|uniref:hypothetical protein n=1 Tax=Salipiger abyssi TaxID=1250539 RepID=UPI000975AD7B|nr:hypothetical protein [Salipiger abyssi]